MYKERLKPGDAAMAALRQPPGRRRLGTVSFAPGMPLADRYVLTDRIGAGGMGEVWRATDEVLGRDVAVKLLALPLASDPALRATTGQEARAAARLAHPHVTQVYDYGKTALAGGMLVPYLVMELVEGESLHSRLQAGPLPWQEAVRVGAEVADALVAAHRLGVVHRDIKPGNVMLTPRGAKVLDFGIATLAGGRADADGDWLVGTPAYAAPERVREGRTEPAIDVYSLGALLYECLTGRPPRRIDRWSEMAAAHALPVAPVHAPGLPADVAALIDRCLRPEQAQRPSTAQVAEALGAAVDRPSQTGAPTVAVPAYGATAVARPTTVEPMPSDADRVAAQAGRGLGRPGRIAVIGAVAAAGLIVVLIVAGLASRRTPVTATSTSNPTSSAAQLPATSAAPAPTDLAGVLAALQAGIDAGVAAGDIDATAARDLRKTLQDRRKQLGHGKQDQVAKRGNEIVNKINELAQQGRIGGQRADELRALLQPIATQHDDQ